MKSIVAFAQVVIDNGFVIPLRNGLYYDVLSEQLFERHPITKRWNEAKLQKYKPRKDYVRRKGKEPEYSI